MRANKIDELKEALEKIDWYFQISDNHPMIQKNVQKCRRIIAETLQKESDNGTNEFVCPLPNKTNLSGDLERAYNYGWAAAFEFMLEDASKMYSHWNKKSETYLSGVNSIELFDDEIRYNGKTIYRGKYKDGEQHSIIAAYLEAQRTKT